MSRERRYARYKREEVWATLYQDQSRLDLLVYDGTVVGHSVLVQRLSTGQDYKAVVLARSSDWYSYSLNCTERWKHGIEVLICGTHDSCLDRLVLAIDAARWYAPGEMRIESLKVLKTDERGYAADRFDRFRRGHYGHNMLLGALLAGREDAWGRLEYMPTSTRLRYQQQVRRLKMRRPGKPLHLGDQRPFTPSP